MRGDMCSFDHGSDPVVLEGISGVLDFPPPPVPGAPPGAPGYTPAPAPPQGVPRPRHPPPRHPQYGKIIYNFCLDISLCCLFPFHAESSAVYVEYYPQHFSC